MKAITWLAYRLPVRSLVGKQPTHAVLMKRRAAAERNSSHFTATLACSLGSGARCRHDRSWADNASRTRILTARIKFSSVTRVLYQEGDEALISSY